MWQRVRSRDGDRGDVDHLAQLVFVDCVERLAIEHLVELLRVERIPEFDQDHALLGRQLSNHADMADRIRSWFNERQEVSRGHVAGYGEYAQDRARFLVRGDLYCSLWHGRRLARRACCRLELGLGGSGSG